MSSNFTNCSEDLVLREGESPTISSVMFSAGVLGNLIALALLARRWRGDSGRSAGRSAGRRLRISLFHVLVTELVFTDLLGTCFISPVVLVSYARNQTLIAMSTCDYFSFSMTFYSLATMLMLFAMALERYLSFGHPYFYQRHISCRAGLKVLPVVYGVSLLFCSLPLLGYGKYVQYCPGTWCFIKSEDSGYLKLYASLLLILIVAVILCNFSVILNLIHMHRRSRRTRCGPSMDRGRGGPGNRRKGERVSMAEETDHLILLTLMTITFAVCSLPFTIFAYMKSTPEDKRWQLPFLRFLSINSIIDPWVFVILRPPVLRLIRSVLCCRISLRTQDATRASPSVVKYP